MREKKMVYDQKKLFDKAVPKTGTQIKGVITKIIEGTLGDFIDSDILKKWEVASKNDEAIQVFFEGENIKKDVTMSLPRTDLGVSVKSKLGKWKKAYGDYPFEGQEVFLTADSDGYFQFAC
jgi:hypothetical protein